MANDGYRTELYVHCRFVLDMLLIKQQGGQAMKVFDLINLLVVEGDDSMQTMEVRIGDVSEGDDLHCSVGKVVNRGGCIVLVPGDDDVWTDEALASNILSQQLWPEEDASED